MIGIKINISKYIICNKVAQNTLRLREVIEETRKHSNRMPTTRSSLYGEGLCPGGSPWQRYPWTETLLWTETPLDRDCPLDKDPWTTIPWTETLGGRPSWKEHGTTHRDARRNIGPGYRYPLPRKNMGPGRQTEIDIIQRPLPLPVDRMTDTRLWKYYLAPMFLCGRSQLLCLYNYSSFTTIWMTHLWVTKYCVHRLRWF